MSQVEQEITLETRGHTAIITLNVPKKLNALNADHYYRLAKLMKEAAAMDNTYITVLTAKGRFFSAGADVSISKAPPKDVDVQRYYLHSFVAQNLNITHAFY
ncbi:hypothetical protein KCU67_g12357, partial [Aureobasidium melanogenum]